MMDSAMISKIMKAKQYASQPDRMQFNAFTVVFTGNHRDHTTSYDHGKWSCTCDFFHQREICSHTMALEKVLEGMLLAVDAPQGELVAA